MLDLVKLQVLVKALVFRLLTYLCFKECSISLLPFLKGSLICLSIMMGYFNTFAVGSDLGIYVILRWTMVELGIPSSKT